MNHRITYHPASRIGLKRFVFFPKSKLEGKAEVDKKAYNDCLEALYENTNVSNKIKRTNCIRIAQNLLSGFCAVNQSRSWFDQNMLPICPEVVLPEGMGVKKWRQGMEYQIGDADVDYKFDFHKYTYMCRGGEVYYLHVLNAVNQYPEYKSVLEKRIGEMITSFPQFSYLCRFVQTTWENRILIPEEDKADISKDLGAIPVSFSQRNEQTLSELENFLNSKAHPFEKMETLANGIILQLLRAMYLCAANDKESNCWVIDVNCEGFSNPECKKAAVAAFKHNEEVISAYLYSGLEMYRHLLNSDDDNMSVGVQTSWQVFDNSCSLDKPTNTIISHIYDEVESSLSNAEPRAIMTIMNKYTQAPYGMNMNAVALFSFYFIAQHGNRLISYYGQEKLTASVISNKIFKGGKLQNNEFIKIRLQINEAPETDAVKDLCRQILKTRDISEFQPLKDTLNSVLAQEGSTPENQGMIAQASVRLDEGIRARKSIDERMTKATEIVDSSSQSLVIHKFVKVLDYLPDLDSPLSEEYDFEYDEKTCDRTKQLKKQFNEILTRGFSTSLEHLTCKITQFSQVRGLYTKAADTLENYDYHDYAEEIRKRIVALESELIARQKYESTLVELDKDIAFFKNCDAIGYTELSEMRTKLAGWTHFVKEEKELPALIAHEKTQQLSAAEKAIANRMERLLADFKNAIDRFQNANTFEELADACRNIAAVSKLGYDSMMLEQLDACIDVHKTIKQSIESFPDNLDELRDHSKKSDVNKSRVLKYELNVKIRELEEKQATWIEKYILPAEKDASMMTAVSCTNWLERTKLLPAFLDKKTIDKYSSVRAEVEKRLHVCKVDGVVSMFKQLSDAEKKACIEELLRIQGD